ncbi:MAG: phthalate 4,5-dioxygenase [Rhodospirillaceae bacterium]|nr:MAG: phthalate 4,5-dioxygenase [Rhodospirillaceae bacterium]
MVTRMENERLTRVTGDAPMGRLMRENYWLPFTRSEGLKPGAAPQRVRLLGQDFVAFRANDGRVGLLDEQCPHRRASLTLARVEDCSLRCIYHGWRMDGTGAVIEVPSEGARSAEFAARVKVNRYRTHEGGGLVWAFLGQGTAPAPPPLPFMSVPPESRWFSRMIVRCNWLQGFEGALDSAHLNWLHRGWPERQHADHGTTASPTYEIEETAYGLRTAAIRKPNTSSTHFRVAEFIAPFYAFSASRQPVIPTDCSVFISVPIDDEAHMLFFGFWDEAGPLTDISQIFPSHLDPDNLVAEAETPENAWGQDREAMAAGHFSGFTKSVLHEDVGVQMSMSPIVDRSQEHLCGTDLAIVRMRRYLLNLLKQFEAGEPLDGALRAYAAERNLPFSCTAPVGADWRREGFRKVAPAQAAAIP